MQVLPSRCWDALIRHLLIQGMAEARLCRHRPIRPGRRAPWLQKLPTTAKFSHPSSIGMTAAVSPAATAAAENSAPATLATSSTCCSAGVSRASRRSISCRSRSGTRRGKVWTSRSRSSRGMPAVNQP